MDKIYFVAAVIIYLAVMVKFTEAGCNKTGGQLASSLLHRKCKDDTDCTRHGTKCVNTGVGGYLCLYCPCNKTEECIVVKKGGWYKFHTCDCADGYYGDHCHCTECNCGHYHPNCQEGWKHHNSNCYHVFTDDETWSNAMQKCGEEPNGKLVRIDDEETNHFLVDSYKDLSETFWIGAHKLMVQNSLIWLWLPDTVNVVYSNWAIGEDTQANKFCAYMKLDSAQGYNGMWFSDECGQEHNFICQYPFPSGGP